MLWPAPWLAAVQAGRGASWLRWPAAVHAGRGACWPRCMLAAVHAGRGDPWDTPCPSVVGGQTLLVICWVSSMTALNDPWNMSKKFYFITEKTCGQLHIIVTLLFYFTAQHTKLVSGRLYATHNLWAATQGLLNYFSHHLFLCTMKTKLHTVIKCCPAILQFALDAMIQTYFCCKLKFVINMLFHQFAGLPKSVSMSQIYMYTLPDWT